VGPFRTPLKRSYSVSRKVSDTFFQTLRFRQSAGFVQFNLPIPIHPIYCFKHIERVRLFRLVWPLQIETRSFEQSDRLRCRWPISSDSARQIVLDCSTDRLRFGRENTLRNLNLPPIRPVETFDFLDKIWVITSDSFRCICDSLHFDNSHRLRLTTLPCVRQTVYNTFTNLWFT